uniref:Serpentine receptor class gamma n=1 Tax=Parastrongyloides trichosuri TaxID=131310 RepID=A0A0N4Z634_PARTI
MIIIDAYTIFLKGLIGVIFAVDITSWIIYLVLIIFLLKCRIRGDQLVSKEFYTLCIFNGILDIIFVVEEYINFRIPQFGIFEDLYLKRLPGTFFAGACYTYSLCQVSIISLSGITITFNRFYAIKYPTKYKHFWSGWKLCLLTVWPVFIVIPIFIGFCDADVNYIVDEERGRFIQNFTDETTNDTIWSITLYIHIFSMILNAILNVFIIITTRSKHKLPKSTNKELRIDITMSKFTLIYFFSFGFVVILEIILFFAFKYKKKEISFNCLTFYILAQTIMVFFSPYTLLFLSKELRSKFFQFCGLTKCFSNINIPFTNSTTSKRVVPLQPKNQS